MGYSMYIQGLTGIEIKQSVTHKFDTNLTLPSDYGTKEIQQLDTWNGIVDPDMTSWYSGVFTKLSDSVYSTTDIIGKTIVVHNTSSNSDISTVITSENIVSGEYDNAYIIKVKTSSSSSELNNILWVTTADTSIEGMAISKGIWNNNNVSNAYCKSLTGITMNNMVFTRFNDNYIFPTKVTDKYLHVDEDGELEWATGGGSTYTAGNGINITNNVIKVADDLSIDNVFADEEFEFTDSTGDFGTNAKSRINSAISAKIDQTYSASSTNAQSGTAVASAVSGKQDTLVSGTNIKTINSSSILGSGNINVVTLADAQTISGIKSFSVPILFVPTSDSFIKMSATADTYSDTLKFISGNSTGTVVGSTELDVFYNYNTGRKVVMPATDADVELGRNDKRFKQLFVSGAVRDGDETGSNAITVAQMVAKQDALSSTQLTATNSGITSSKVSTYDGYATTIAGKQDTLVSGTNIKTINNTSVLGSGNISTGNVTGPSTQTTDGIATWSSTSKTLQSTGVTIDSGGNMENVSAVLFPITAGDTAYIGEDSEGTGLEVSYDGTNHGGFVSITAGDGLYLKGHTNDGSSYAGEIQVDDGGVSLLGDVTLDASGTTYLTKSNTESVDLAPLATTVASRQDKYVHANATTGALEWTTVSGGTYTAGTFISIDNNVISADLGYSDIYSISGTLSNLTMSGSSEIEQGGSASVTLVASSGYALPSTLTSVTGATYSYDSSTGVVSLSSATGDVVITASGEVEAYTATPYQSSFMVCMNTIQYSKDNTNWYSITDTSSTPVTLTDVSIMYFKITAGFSGATLTILSTSGTQLLSTSIPSDGTVYSYTLTQDIQYNIYDGTCLSGDTLVLTNNGYEEIQNIGVGTTLLTYNDETGTNEYNNVTKWWHHKSNDLVIINDGLFTMTGDHPIYINDYSVVKGREVKVGDYLIDKDGNKVLVENVEYSNNEIEVYMIEVENNHNFYITEKDILSHNY